MTWHCESCGTTLTWAYLVTSSDPGMTKCPRCDKWMERVRDGDDAQVDVKERAKGVCPDCGRTISGKAEGPERLAGDRRWVALSPHNREEFARHPVACLSRGGRRVVPRIRE